MADRYNLCIGEDYENAKGEKKVAWNRIGQMFTAKNGKRYVKLYAMPGTLISAFPDEPKETTDSAEPEVPSTFFS